MPFRAITPLALCILRSQGIPGQNRRRLRKELFTITSGLGPGCRDDDPAVLSDESKDSPKRLTNQENLVNFMSVHQYDFRVSKWLFRLQA